MEQSELKRIIFRPAITGMELLEISALFKKYAPLSDLGKKFETQVFKMNNGSSNPVYTRKASVETSLGLDGDIGLERTNNINVKREQAFAKWQIDPALCDADELGLVQAYRIDKGLLSSIELAQIEQDKLDILFGYKKRKDDDNDSESAINL